MKVGLLLPSFRASMQPALEVARASEAAGLDGVFAFDHTIRFGVEDGPIVPVFELLNAVAEESDQITIGTLVARVGGLRSNDDLSSELMKLEAKAADRVIAALGIGDSHSAKENAAAGIGFADRATRLEMLLDLTYGLRHVLPDLPIWFGGRSAAVAVAADRAGVALNVWDAPIEELLGRPTAMTWAGVVDVFEESSTRQLLRDIESTGATWAVLSPKGGADGAGVIETLARQAAELS